jgi:hypothetical protein
MPTGFMGNAASSYLELIESALSEAVSAHNRRPFSGLSSATTGLPALPTIRNEITPHAVSTASSGGNSTGYGNSNNIVVDVSSYETLFGQLNDLDDSIGRTLIKAATDIERLCRGSFILPRTVQQSNIITRSFKNEMDKYRSLTVDTLTRMRRFVYTVMYIG